MPIKGIGITVTYIAWNASTNSGKTGDSANHTLRLIIDGVESIPSGLPIEVDATNAPGVYLLSLSSSEMNASIVNLVGKSSTSGVSIIPVRLVNS